MTSTIPAISNETLTSLNAGVQPVSQRIRQRLVDQGISFLANDNVAAFIETGELDELEHEVADRVRELLRSWLLTSTMITTLLRRRACGSDVSP